MSGRFILMAAGLLAGILIGIGDGCQLVYCCFGYSLKRLAIWS